ncbi:MAG: Rrf2 family transcriptional regulator [Candidatus Tectomicrobia bacterium]|nr:Rrf2 family transcriptional regulator [Candidatus Tectomicrobia bacterium]
MKLNKESEYGLKGLIFLASQPWGTVMLLSEIAKAQGLPQSFLAKIFQKFVQHGLVRSYRGKQRGYGLAKPLTAISLKEILEAVEGPDLFDRCLFWSKRCADTNPCQLHNYWKEIKPQLIGTMERMMLKDLVS